MLTFRTTDRAALEARIAGRLADYGRLLLACDANGGDSDTLAKRLLDLACGRNELAQSTAPAHQELVIGHLLSAHDLNRVAVPVLSAVPYTLALPSGGAGGPVYWANVLNKPALVTPAQLNTALLNLALPRAITVSLSGGKMAGTLKSGDYIPAGTILWDLLDRALVESILPTYTPALIGLSQSAPVVGEVGEVVTNTLVGSFTRNDAGALVGLRIQRDGTDLTSNGGSTLPAANPTSPATRTDVQVRTLAGVSYRAVAAYNAGAARPVAPAGTPDTRPAQVRRSDAPQAAETDFASGALSLVGYHRVFFGATATPPTTSAAVRSLPGSQLTNGGDQLTLVTGTTQQRFAVVLAPGQAITNVTDLDNQNANITAAYQAQGTVDVADAGGRVTARPLYLFSAVSPYPASARHLITYA